MRIGVILATYGEPERNSFAEQWVYSYRILEKLTRKIAPIPRPVLPIIATSRARGRVRLWRENRFLSPLERLHRESVDALRAELRRRGVQDVLVEAGYEFRKPGVGDALESLRRQGCGRVIVVPMYVADGDFTHGMTRLAVDEALERGSWDRRDTIDYCFLSDDAPSAERLTAVLASHCVESMRRRGVPDGARDWAIMLAAHGTVVTSPPGVDNGLMHAAPILNRLKALLRPHVGLVRVGWLNHTRGGKWTTPAVPHALEEVRSRGFRNLVYFPWGFTTDNAETSLEGAVALRELSSPFERVVHLECLNAGQALISLLADRLCPRLGRAAAPAATQPVHAA